MAAKKPKPPKDTRSARTKALINSTIITENTFTRVAQPKTEFVSPRVDFFASQLKNVCRTSPKKAACFRVKPDGSRGGRYTPKDLGLDKGPSPQEIQSACAEVEGEFVGAGIKPIRPGKVELDFLSKAQAEALKTLPGPNLRLCRTDDEKGLLVPVSSPDHARHLKRRFDRCVQDDKGRMPACALKVATNEWRGGSPPLGFFGAGGGLVSGLFRR